MIEDGYYYTDDGLYEAIQEKAYLDDTHKITSVFICEVCGEYFIVSFLEIQHTNTQFTWDTKSKYVVWLKGAKK